MAKKNSTFVRAPEFYSLKERLEFRSRRNTNGCLEWTGAKTPTGYGCIRFKRKYIRTHRACYEAHYGPIPDGLHVLHDCDNPSCIEISHLRLGTQKTNMEDMIGKGRANKVKGENHPSNKISPSDIPGIRSSKESLSSIAKRFGVNLGTIWKIKKRLIWKHI